MRAAAIVSGFRDVDAISGAERSRFVSAVGDRAGRFRGRSPACGGGWSRRFLDSMFPAVEAAPEQNGADFVDWYEGGQGP